MNFDFQEFCQKNQITNVLVSDSCDLLGSVEKTQLHLELNFIHSEKKLAELGEGDLNQVDLVWIEESGELVKNFEHVMDRILNLGVSWVWISNLKISDYPEQNPFLPLKIEQQISVPLKIMVQLMEKNMYSIFWSKSTYGQSVKNLLLKKF
jgi:hypothetical protein